VLSVTPPNDDVRVDEADDSDDEAAFPVAESANGVRVAVESAPEADNDAEEEESRSISRCHLSRAFTCSCDDSEDAEDCRAGADALDDEDADSAGREHSPSSTGLTRIENTPSSGVCVCVCV
jgi:hypothetical protein